MPLSTSAATCLLLQALAEGATPEAAQAWQRRQRSRPSFKPLAGLADLDLRGPSWPREEEAAGGVHDEDRRLNASSSASPAPKRWLRASHEAEHVAADGGRIAYSATAKPHSRWFDIVSVDLEEGVASLACKALGDSHVDVLLEASEELLRRLQRAVEAARGYEQRVLLVGSNAWRCSGSRHWYISINHARLLESGDAANLQGRWIDLHEAFEDFELSLNVQRGNESGESAVDRQRRLFLGDFVDLQALEDFRKRFSSGKGAEAKLQESTEYGFNWDFEANAAREEVLSLVDVGTSGERAGGRSFGATFTADCIQCFARAVASLDIKYGFTLGGGPRIYMELTGDAELHGWLEAFAEVGGEATWERLLAEFELPSLHVSVLLFAVEITPFTRLQSSLSLSGGRLSGALRGGFGARGRATARFEMNTKGWSALPPGRTGVSGVDTSFDFQVARRFVPPTFGVEADDMDVILRLKPSVGIRLWNSFSAEAGAEVYIGAQVVDKDAPFNFARASKGVEGQLYGRPVALRGVSDELANRLTSFSLKLRLLGEEVVHTSDAQAGGWQIQERSILGDAEDASVYDFGTASWTGEMHLRFDVQLREQALQRVNVEAQILYAEMPVLEGARLCFGGSSCSKRPVLGGWVLTCSCDIQLDSNAAENAGRLSLKFVFVPSGTEFPPPSSGGGSGSQSPAPPLPPPAS
eukprot:TRINITY_DN28464_c0_g1_i1.p1 TRINITY_DN28464_c0_g1~~TRINITY_DN28464_c0_g1_i1.p1  ORF type:complete len:697 (+),score=158.74 TRINITY_DN28464_c0_g1_i1:77-2167(+)